MAECFEWRPALLQQDSPWKQSMETSEPQTHRCFSSNETPRRNPTARRSCSLPRRKPKFGDERAVNHEPDEVELLANNLTLLPASAAASHVVNCAELI